MAPVVHGLEAEYYGKIAFYYLDIDDPRTEPFRRQLGFRYQPHFFLLDGQGNIIQTWVGGVTQMEFVRAFSALLGQ